MFSNHLVEDPDLTIMGCAYMPDYDIIVCLNTKGDETCRLGIPLADLFSHCYIVHSIPFCKKRDPRAGKLRGGSYSSIQKSSLHRILYHHPNIVSTLHELRDLRPGERQQGPIANILQPVEGVECSRCNFAIRISESEGLTNVTSEPMRLHWRAHVNSSESPAVAPIKRGEDVLLERKFLRCLVQSFDPKRSVWMKVPSGHPTIPSVPTQSFHQILASSNQIAQSSAIIDRTPLLPFFQQNRAYHIISPLSPAEIFQLIALPTQHSLDSCLSRLKHIVIKRFEKLCKTITNTSDLVRELLVKPRE